MNRNFPMLTLWIKLVLAVLLCVASVAPLAAPPAAASPGRSPMRAAAGGGTVVAWGCGDGYDSGQCTVPMGLSDVTAIVANWGHSLALNSDGTVVSWGCGVEYDDGQCMVPAGLSGVTAIAAGGWHSLALKGDGTVVAWGMNVHGQATVPAGLTGVTAIAGGSYHSLALKSDGTVVAWGCGGVGWGQCTVPAGLSGVTAIAAGGTQSLALKSDGTVVAWGCENGYPIWAQCMVPAGLSGVTAIAAGLIHSLALKSDGTIVAWGDNSYGQTTVPAGLSGVTAIAASIYHSLALKSDGTVVAWGMNVAGQATVPAGLTGVTATAAGGYHSLAIVHGSTVTLTVDAGGPYTVTEGASIIVTASGSDLEGGPLTYAWDLDGNGTFETPGQAVTYTAALGSAGTFTITVQATDNGGLSTTDSAVIDVQPSNNQAVKLFAVSSQGGASTNEIYRYDIAGPTSAPVLERTIIDPSFDAPCCLAFNNTGELFVINRSASHASGSISRLLNPTGVPVSNGTITSPHFYGPHLAVFRDSELFIAQEGGSNTLRFTFDASGNAQFNGAITAGLSPGTPRGVTVSPDGDELFVTECCYASEISHYIFDGIGSAILNDTIAGNGLSNPHDMVFSPWGELFVANAGNNSISRFVFDAAGNAVPNGQITGPTLNGPIGLDFSPWGELFVSNHFGSGGVSRFLFGSTHNAIPNGFFATSNTLGDLQFYPLPTSGNQPPTVNAGGPYSVNEGASITVTASGNDPEGGSLTYEWDLDNDGIFETAGQGVTFSAAGLDGPSTHTVAVRATDSSGLSDTDQATVTVENVAPSITSVSNSGPIAEGASATITVAATDAAGMNDPLSYEFDCDGDGAYEIGPQPGDSAACTFGDNGSFVVNVRVSDDDGGADTDSTTVIVNNVAPTATFQATSPISEGSPIGLSLVNPFDPSGADMAAGFTYAFDCGDGADYGPYGASNTASCPTDDNGARTVRGTIRDKDGGAREYTATVTIDNVAPTATFTNSTDLVIEGESAIVAFTNPFDPSAADTAAGFTYLYDCMGDGTFESGDTPTTSYACQYLVSGVYAAMGRIRDKDGGFTDYPVAVTVQTPQGATEILSDEVEDLISRGELNQGQGNALTTKLSNIIAKLDQGNTDAAINQLQAFINQVNDLIATSVLSSEEGQPLIDVASRIIAVLGG